MPVSRMDAARAVSDYAAFLATKAHANTMHGFEPVWIPPFLYDFQARLVEWAVQKGRAAIFADCGLGKTPMQLVWAENVARHTDRPVLIVTPLAVSHQVVREAEKFGLECRRVTDGRIPAGARLVVTNYERLERFSAADVGGVVCDESSILKNFDGVRRGVVTDFLRTLPYRLLCTATAAPNDYIELGTSSEALGELGYMDMLARFFKNDQATLNPVRRWLGRGVWRFNGHAETPFWQWVCTWARAIRRPSDLGFDDGRFQLPPLEEIEHRVMARATRDDLLFDLPAVGLSEERAERRRTLAERCEMVAALVAHADPAMVWCHMNDEGDRLAALIPDAEQISGADDEDTKEARLLAFARGDLRVLITKPKIGAWGLNLQHCAHVTTFPSHSYEAYYQGVRRCWRFGQTRPVRVDIITTEGEQGVLANVQRKARQADRMFSALVTHMQDAQHRTETLDTKPEEVPAWL